MLKWALIFAVVALIAGALGFGGIAGAAAGIAKLLFFVAVVGFLIFLALGVFAGRKIMGDYTNGRLMNVFSWLTVGVLIALSVALVIAALIFP